MTTIDDLRKEYPHNFRRNLQGDEYIWLYSEDLIHSDTLGCSNVESIERDFEWAEIKDHPWYREVCASVEAIEQHDEDCDEGEEWAEEVYDLIRSLECYPVYDDGDYSDLEHERLMEYVENSLPWDLCYEIDNRTDECEARIKHWISNNMDAVWECNDGSVDDQPINVTDLAKELPYWIGELA